MLALIVFRRIYKALPVFSSYLLFQLIAVGVSYSLREFSKAWNVYLALTFLNSAFILAVLGELFLSLLRLFRSSLPPWTPLAVAFSLALAYAATWQFVRGLDAIAWSIHSIANTMYKDKSR